MSIETTRANGFIHSVGGGSRLDLSVGNPYLLRLMEEIREHNFHPVAMDLPGVGAVEVYGEQSHSTSTMQWGIYEPGADFEEAEAMAYLTYQWGPNGRRDKWWTLTLTGLESEKIIAAEIASRP